MSAANCEKHPFEFAESACFDCGHDACQECLVFVRGAKKPAICIDCSLVAAGLRHKATRQPKYEAKSMRILRKDLLRQHKEKLKTETKPADRRGVPDYDPLAEVARTSTEPELQPEPEPEAVPEFQSARQDEDVETPAWQQSWQQGWDTTPAFTTGNG